MATPLAVGAEGATTSEARLVELVTATRPASPCGGLPGRFCPCSETTYAATARTRAAPSTGPQAAHALVRVALGDRGVDVDGAAAVEPELVGQVRTDQPLPLAPWQGAHVETKSCLPLGERRSCRGARTPRLSSVTGPAAAWRRRELGALQPERRQRPGRGARHLVDEPVAEGEHDCAEQRSPATSSADGCPPRRCRRRRESPCPGIWHRSGRSLSTPSWRRRSFCSSIVEGAAAPRASRSRAPRRQPDAHDRGEERRRGRDRARAAAARSSASPRRSGAYMTSELLPEAVAVVRRRPARRPGRSA